MAIVFVVAAGAGGLPPVVAVAEGGGSACTPTGTGVV